MLSGYEPNTLTANEDYEYDNGLIGANDTYDSTRMLLKLRGRGQGRECFS